MFVKEYYSEWLSELEWLLTSLSCAACMFTGCPHASNHIIWKKNADDVIADVKIAMSKKEKSLDSSCFQI